MQEILISFVLILLLVLVANPFDFWMPDMFAMAITLCLLIVFALFAAIMWRETPKDEREGFHIMFAGRIAYLAGAATVLLGIIYQSFVSHVIDPWLVLTLGVMVVAKAGGLMYGRRHR